jgi:hypothetical protein
LSSIQLQKIEFEMNAIATCALVVFAFALATAELGQPGIEYPEGTFIRLWKNNTVDIEFRYSAVQGAASYVLTVYTLDTVKTPIVKKITTTKVTLTFTKPVQYFWNVHAVDAKGVAGHTSYGYFWVEKYQEELEIAELSGPRIEYPEGTFIRLWKNNTVDIAFKWSKVQGAASYKMTIYTMDTVKEPVVRKVNEPTVTLTLTKPDQYFWNVRAVDAKGVAGQVTYGYFWVEKSAEEDRLIAELPSPKIVFPEGTFIHLGRNKEVDIAFQWEEVQGAVSYVMNVDSRKVNEPATHKTTALKHTVTFNETDEYFWNVHAVDAKGAKGLSSYGYFYIE